MNATHVHFLSEVLKRYIPIPEMYELAQLFDVSLADYDDSKSFHFDAAKYFIANQNLGNIPRLLASLLDSCLDRNRLSSSTNREELESRSSMREKIELLLSAFNEFSIPEELSTPESSPFRAKSFIRDMLDEATTPVRLVDQYIGTRTLDCVRDLWVPISILTGTKPRSLEDGFLRSLSDFRSDGHEIDVRNHSNFHDRYIMFNNRVWLLGCSLKDAGRKTFSAIEIVDTKQTILDSVDKLWADAKVVG